MNQEIVKKKTGYTASQDKKRREAETEQALARLERDANSNNRGVINNR